MNGHLRVAATALLCGLYAAWGFAQAAPAGRLLELGPGKAGEFELVERPTKALVAKMRSEGRKPLVVDTTLFDEAVAFTNWAENASAVAFDMLPRAHLLQSWRSLGVTVLKTVRFDPEGSADRFRREISFIAFQDGADGIWLPTPETDLPEPWRKALAEAREDWRIMSYLRSLERKAAMSKDGLVVKESRRVQYWFGWMPADRENLDVLRLECVAYARRLEQVLGLPEASLPTRRSEPIEPQTLPVKPYADLDEKPPQGTMRSISDALDFGDGLSFKASYKGFEITYSVTNGPVLAWGEMPGGSLDLRLYIPGDEPGSFLPYRFRVDLDPQHYGEPRAPMTGRKYAFINVDERFRPFHMAYGVPNDRVWLLPRLRDFSSAYPDPMFRSEVRANKNGGWHVKLSFQWVHLYGHWPMMKNGKSDLWFIGLDKSPETGRPITGRVLWPRGAADSFVKFCEAIDGNVFSDIYRRELRRTRDLWGTGHAERYYPFIQTKTPTFSRYDPDSDWMFSTRLVQPLIDANANAWELLETDKNNKSTIMSKPDKVRNAVWANLGNMIFLSEAVAKRRLEYLEGRWRGELPPEYKSRAETAADKSPAAPDADYDDGAIELDDKEY